MSPETNQLDLASWNQPRSTEQLQEFISRRESEIDQIEQ